MEISTAYLTFYQDTRWHQHPSKLFLVSCAVLFSISHNVLIKYYKASLILNLLGYHISEFRKNGLLQKSIFAERTVRKFPNYLTLLERLQSHLSAFLIISRYILRLGQRGRCCFCAACPNCKMYLEIMNADERALHLTLNANVPEICSNAITLK